MTPPLTHDRYYEEIAHQAGQLRTVVTSGADLSGTVPTPPDRSLEQLVRHTGGALRRLPSDAPGPDVFGDRKLLEFWLERATSG